MARRRVIVGVVAAVVAIVALFLIFGGKDNSILPPVLGGPDTPVAEFQFKKVTTGAISTLPNTDKKQQEKAAKEATPDVQAVVTAVLQAGYVDPDSWGDADAIKDSFTGAAADQVEPNIDTLTLGSNAADVYESVTPTPSRLKVTALTDGDAKVIRAMAEFTFKGKAALKDGTAAKITVNGTFFLVPDGNSWTIEAFRIEREIKPQQPKASASSATASSSESG